MDWFHVFGLGGRRASLTGVFLAFFLGMVPPLHGQEAPTTADETAEEQKERVAAQRFLQLLKRRPRLGTALDKVYGFHVGRGSLDAFCAELRQEADKNSDGKLWLVLGMVQMQRGQDAAAVASLEQAEKMLPDEPLVCHYLGKTLVLLGEVDEAADAMRRAIARKPSRPDMLAVFQDLGRIYQRIGRNEEALEVWQQLEQLFPGDAMVQEKIAAVLAEEGATEAALERYSRLSTELKDRFRKIEMAIRAAQLKAELGRNEEALADFEQQLAIVNPDSWLHRDIRRRIEEIFWASGDIDGLVKYYSKWVELHPEDVDAMMRTARVLAIQRRMPEAEKWFRKAIKKAPTKTGPRIALVDALVTDDRYGQAAKEMSELVELQSDNPDFIVRWGELVFNDDDRDEATRIAESNEIWRRLLSKRGDDPVTVARVADLFRGSGSDDAAIELYKKAIELSPAEPQYREYLGEYQHQLGQKEAALATWRELAAGERKNRDNLVRLSEVFGTFGYPVEALETMADACERKPTFGHRARYAELLREAERYEESLAQLDLAETLADEPELRATIIDERIKNYRASGELLARIEQAEADVEGDKANDPLAWRLLALLHDANRQFQAACEAIDRATALDDGNVLMWEANATLKERSGRFGDAVKAYRKLATIDRRMLSNYLTQIASLEMRLGNSDAALKVGEELLASAPGNSDHHRFFADLCFRTGENERGLEVLRRNVRSNPNDDEALLYLSRKLADEFKTDEAIELNWRGFDLAKDINGKATVINSLAELYLRSNRFDTLIDRLELMGREQNKPRDGILWKAAAYQAAGDLGMAKRMLEQLARQDSRDTELLEQLVTLSRAEYDFTSAAEYQKRLVAAAPTPSNQYALANILLELGEIDQAETLWLKLSQRRGDPQALSKSVRALIGKEELETAEALIDKAMSKQADDWELLGQAMIVYARIEKPDQGQEIADRVLAMKVSPETPTAAVKLQIAKYASKTNVSSNRYNRYQGLGQPSRLLQIVGEIKQTLVPGATNRYTGRQGRNFTPLCFQDVWAMAQCMPLITDSEDFDESEFIQTFAKKAVESGQVEDLWQAILYLTWESPELQYGQQQNDTYSQCVQKLVDAKQAPAAELMIASFINTRQRNFGGNFGQATPLSEDEIVKLKAWSELASTGQKTQYGNHYDLWLAVELSRSGDDDGAEEIIDRYVDAAKDGPNSVNALLQVANMLLNRQMNPEPKPAMVDKARELMVAVLEELKSSQSLANTGASHLLPSIISQLIEMEEFDEAINLVDAVFVWQAKTTAAMRPSLRDRLQSNGTPFTYHHYLNGQFQRVSIPFPTASGYFGTESILAVHALYLACNEDKERSKTVQEWLRKLADQPSDDPYLRLVRMMALASHAFWTDQKDRTIEILQQANDLKIGTQFIQLTHSRLLYESGKIREALAEVEKLRPTNQRMLVDRELTILQLLLQLGDLDRARKSAQKLFALRLDSNTQFKLTDVMYQLGMRDLGDRMMGRIQRRSGGKQDTLAQLMTRYANAKDEKAVEIARQIIRRTSPRTSPNSMSSGNQQHGQAVRVLQRMNQLTPLIERYEKLVERSPKSTKLAHKLAAFYDVAGRREDARKLRLSIAKKSTRRNPRSLFQAGQQLASTNNHAEAVEKFIAAIRKSPDLLNQNYHEMRTSFESTKGWGKLADAIVDEGIKKFSQSYQLSQVARELAQAKEMDVLNRLVVAAMTELNWQGLTQMSYWFSQTEFAPSKELVEILGKKLTDENASFDGLEQFNFSRSSNGKTTGVVNTFAQMIKNDDQLSLRVRQAMTARIKKDDQKLFPRLLLAHLQAARGDLDAMRSTFTTVCEKEEKTNLDGQAIWNLASALTHEYEQPAVACELLASVKDPKIWQRGPGTEYRYSVSALMSHALQKAGRHAEARKILMETLQTLRIDENQSANNPGYGEYQYINSHTKLAERFIQMDYPVEAYIAYSKAFGDEAMLERADRWGGNWEYQRQRLQEQITNKTDADAVLEIVAAVTGQPIEATDDPDSAEQQSQKMIYEFLTQPAIHRNSLVDTRLTMPLDEFAVSVSENDVLRRSVADWLDQNPIPEELESVSLKSLAARLLLCDTVDDDQQIEATAQAFSVWLESHQPADSDQEGAGNETEDGDAPLAADPANQNEEKDWPDELLLGLAALKMPKTESSQADVVQMLERAIAAAQSIDAKNLTISLRCELARRVARDDPDFAREAFMQTLDEIMPVGTSEE